MKEQDALDVIRELVSLHRAMLIVRLGQLGLLQAVENPKHFVIKDRDFAQVSDPENHEITYTSDVTGTVGAVFDLLSDEVLAKAETLEEMVEALVRFQKYEPLKKSRELQKERLEYRNRQIWNLYQRIKEEHPDWSPHQLCQYIAEEFRSLKCSYKTVERAVKSVDSRLS